MGFSGITIGQWQAGIDVRRGPTQTPRTAFRDLLNCYLTPGRTVRKRPGLRMLASVTYGQYDALDPAIVACPVDGQLWIFKPQNAPITGGYGVRFVDSYGVTLNATGWTGGMDGTTRLGGVYRLEKIGGLATVKHTYTQSSPPPTPGSEVPNATDAGFDGGGMVFVDPYSGAMVAMAERIYAVDGEMVRMSDVVDPRQWLPPTGTQPQLAGYINVGLHQTGGVRTPTALGRYKDKMVVFFPNSAQVWTVDSDPALHKLDTMVDGVGCRWPRAIANIAGDCIALDDSGLRSISIVDAFGNIADVDVGSPVDALVRQSIADITWGVFPPGVEPCAVYAPASQQVLFAIGRDVYVLTFSRSTRLAAWSRWQMPGHVVWMEEMNGHTYIRCRNTSQAGAVYDTVYLLDDTLYDDDIYDPVTGVASRTPFQVRAELPFLDCGTPGSLKSFYGWDAVVQGSATVRFRLDPADPSVETVPVEVSGDTSPGASIAIQASSVAIQPVIEGLDSNPWELEALTIYFASRGLR